MDFTLPTERRCQWYPGADMSACPHVRTDWKRETKIAANILETIGNTPLVKLNKIPQSMGIKCDILAKLEYFNPGGSGKDRASRTIIQQAEADEAIKPGLTTIIVPSGGNSGVGTALVTAVLGYPTIVVSSEKISTEKVSVIEALGARIVLTPIKDGFFSPTGVFGTCYKLCAEIGTAWIFDQFKLAGNPMAHFDTTAEEILDQCDGELAMFVAAAGTGGTLSGVAQKLKEACPNCKTIGVDPWGSHLAKPAALNQCNVTTYEIEGIGCEIEPVVINYNVIDEWQKVGDLESHQIARRLIKEEGILCGPSGGAAISVALRQCAKLAPGEKCVVIITDTSRNYIQKLLDDHWMEAKKFSRPINAKGHWWWDSPITDMKQLKEAVTGTTEQSVHRIFHQMKKNETNIVVIVDPNTKGIVGVADQYQIINNLIAGNVTETDKIEKAMNVIYPKATPDSSVGLLSRILQVSPYVVICKEEGDHTKLINVITPMDILHYTANQGTRCC